MMTKPSYQRRDIYDKILEQCFPEGQQQLFERIGQRLAEKVAEQIFSEPTTAINPFQEKIHEFGVDHD